MAQSRDSSPVYYREIQKNAYLKRVPDETSGGKLRPLALKKTQLKPLWTQLCVHNGRTPYIEQYRDPASARAHRPAWRASLAAARHVTAGVTECHFLIDTRDGPVRMLAPDWESMQDWVATLRNKLHELKIVSLCENVYVAAAPAPPAPRAAARDPTSPLPPTPPLPPQRVPGIDLSSVTRGPAIPEERPDADTEVTPEPEIDISPWDDLTLPSTSQAPTSVAKICGQNICLDDSLFKRGDSDDENNDDYRQTVVVAATGEDVMPDDRPSNVTVIQVSNKDPPHTAIPVIGSETDVFNFDFKTTDTQNPTFVNIVNTETDRNDYGTDARNDYGTDARNDYGTVFNGDSDYGHLSLTTTVSLTGDVTKEDLYERLCMASTKPSPLPVRKLKSQEKLRKSSLPNLDTVNSTYEYLFLSQNTNNSYDNVTSVSSSTSVSTNSTSVSTNSTSVSTSNTALSTSTINANIKSISTHSTSVSNHSTAISTHSTSVSNHSAPIPTHSTAISTHSAPVPTHSTAISTHSTPVPTHSTAISTHSTSVSTHSAPVPTHSTSVSTHSTSVSTHSTPIPTHSTSNTSTHSIPVTSTQISNTSIVTMDAVNGRNLVAIVDSNTRGLRSNIERTQSQNSYDTSPRRERRQNDGQKVNGKDKSEPQHKPIWKRGLTELSLLSRLRGIGQGKRSDSPHRQTDNDRSGLNSPAKVVHRSRPEARVDRNTRRSSSLSNGQSPPCTSSQALQPLRARQAAALVAAQRRGAALVGCVSTADPPVFADYNKQVWVAWWGAGGARHAGRAGDRVCGLRAAAPIDAHHARQLLHSTRAHAVDILYHRVPLGKMYVVNKRDQETIGIKLDNECNITWVEPESPAARAGIPPPGRWAVTEVNNRPLNLIKGGDEDMNRLSLHGSEASVLIQPSALVKKLRAALKGNKTLLGLR